MKATIEGVVDSSAIEAGQRTTVEWTGTMRTMARQGLIRVLEWHAPEPPAEEPKPARRSRRRAKPAD
ncbi:hypothetical protein [Nocardia carnea]|uniref:hypothetical protein n=1 Tax=Nocardia carnea TaxID=37328 RepID=UPI0024572B01|nr:hypothetical protein [Nocardia carnea]